MLLTCTALVAGAFAFQKVQSPKPGSALRKAVLDSLRVPAEKMLKGKVVFQVTKIQVLGNWAFVQGRPLQPNGKPFDYHGTRYQEAIDAGAFDDGILGLLKKSGSKWTVLEWNIGATDWPVEEWARKHHAPMAVIR